MSINPSNQDFKLHRVNGGYINNTGELVLELPQNSCNPRPFSEGLAAVRCIVEPGICLGYIDKTGELVIQPRFFDAEGLEGAENFSEGLAAVAPIGAEDDEYGYYYYGYIDRTGEMVIPPQFYGVRAFSEGIAVVEFLSEMGSRFAFINQQGNTIFEHPQAYEALDSSEGLAAVRINELWGFIDASGEFVITPQFSDVSRFSNGLAPSARCTSNRSERHRRQYGYINHAGDFVIQPQFAYAHPFSEGLAAVKVNDDVDGLGGKWGYIDTNGQFVIPPQFQGTFLTESNFSEGLAAMRIPDPRLRYNGKWGYIDRTGHFVIPPQFNQGASPFMDGLASVSLMFEIEGRDVQNLDFSFTNLSRDEILAKARSNMLSMEPLYAGGKSGYINQTGDFVWEVTTQA
jgi:hypothetical protein